jgi:hypothetical protein
MSGFGSRFTIHGMAAGVALAASLLVAPGRAAEPVAFTRIQADEYASFPVNWDEAATPVFRGLLRTPDEYAAVFHPAPVMRSGKPFAPPAGFFADGMVLVVARVIDAPAAGETPLAVESLEAEGDELVLHYRFTPPAATATYTVKEVLAVRIPNRPYGRVRFVENGAPVGDLRVADGEWAVPKPAAD